MGHRFLFVCVVLAAMITLDGASMVSYGQPNGAGSKTYVFMDEPYPPFTEGRIGDLATRGLSVDVLRAVFSGMESRFELHLAPFARALKAVEDGEADGMPLIMDSPDRRRYMVFSHEVLHGREFLYVSADNEEFALWKGRGQLVDKSLGLVRGYTYTEEFMKRLPDLDVRIYYSKDSEQNVKKLAEGRTDLIVGDEFLIMSVLRRNPELKDRIRRVGEPVGSYGWNIGISRGSPLAKRMDELNEVLRKLKADGTMEAIFSRYR